MRFLKKLGAIVSHSVFIGITLSLIFAFLTLNILTQIIDWSASLGHEKPKSILAAETLHLKTVDYRLWARGPRKGAPQVALLDVDDDSIGRIGRWPWPRERMAKIIDEVVKYGGKVIAFDITFSEPSSHPTKKLYDTHNLQKVLPPNVNAIIKDKIEKLDSDTILSRMFQRHAEKVVIGGFNEEPSYLLNANDIERACYQIYYPITSTAVYWDTQFLPLIPLDKPTSYYNKGLLLEEIVDAYRTHFSSLYLEKLKQLARDEQLRHLRVPPVVDARLDPRRRRAQRAVPRGAADADDDAEVHARPRLLRAAHAAVAVGAPPVARLAQEGLGDRAADRAAGRTQPPGRRGS